MRCKVGGMIIRGGSVIGVIGGWLVWIGGLGFGKMVGVVVRVEGGGWGVGVSSESIFTLKYKCKHFSLENQDFVGIFTVRILIYDPGRGSLEPVLAFYICKRKANFIANSPRQILRKTLCVFSFYRSIIILTRRSKSKITIFLGTQKYFILRIFDNDILVICKRK